MTDSITTVQDIIAPTDTQRAFLKARNKVNAAIKAHRAVKAAAGLWATGDLHVSELEESKDDFTDRAGEAYVAIDALGADMRPSDDIRAMLVIPKDIQHGGDLKVMLKVAMPGGGKLTAAVRTFLKG